MNMTDSRERRASPLQTPTGLSPDARRAISGALNLLLADVYSLYIKTKNFQWHVSGPHFHDYHLLLDEQANQIFAIADAIAERVRKVGGTTLRSIAHIARLKRVPDNDAYYVTPLDMLAELRDDNKGLAAHMREAHGLCGKHGDVPTASLLEAWIDEAERRVWFLFEASRARVISGAGGEGPLFPETDVPRLPRKQPGVADNGRVNRPPPTRSTEPVWKDFEAPGPQPPWSSFRLSEASSWAPRGRRRYFGVVPWPPFRSHRP